MADTGAEAETQPGPSMMSITRQSREKTQGLSMFLNKEGKLETPRNSFWGKAFYTPA